ncbi:YveK family protein [[Clostridium] symbiosum]|uniref:YveK family protein n=1 Tax=Clostridium symbiosum TaxID=1512 RepID=UPI0025A45D80|nr:Wzz/FepE/Etk N-terminal domain-containing protein [[Clostridium] symbiosum]MDM8135669.1 Wzz/FepE/Etk N-terminal domain-containing protein [[Clostridium] symbiosum]MDM8140021.1 Wzz/FepE/Etk N-terminal domain-containing protein [[Clostridium] symbiosum]MDM8319928.1 Wzz/FepE/Etk N-terminal domain-containing protein [[Clostridium] symbiosum]
MEKITHQHLDDDEIVIDFWELFYEFKRRIWWILLAAVLGTGAAGAYSYYLLTPQYISEAKIYVLSKETTLTSLADLQMGTQLTQDYKELIGSRPVMQEVINTLNLDITYRQLAEKLKLENPKDTRILYLTVTDPNPYMAKAIVDEIANAASDYIGEIMEMTPPKLIEDGMVATVQTSPNVKKNAAVGGLVMLVLACGVITLSVIMNDTIKSEEDVFKYLELPVLAVVPERKDSKVERSSSSGRFFGRKKKVSGKRGSRKKTEITRKTPEETRQSEKTDQELPAAALKDKTENS